jgi:hypothetical protein
MLTMLPNSVASMQRIVAKMQRLFSEIAENQQHTHDERWLVKRGTPGRQNFYSRVSCDDWEIKAHYDPRRGRLFFDVSGR